MDTLKYKCKAFTSLEQSRKLAEILPLESADMGYIPLAEDDDGNTLYTTEYKSEIIFDEDCIPCWSLAALINILPRVYGLKPVLDLEECSIQYSGVDLYVTASNSVDACVAMIKKLNELNLL